MQGSNRYIRDLKLDSTRLREARVSKARTLAMVTGAALSGAALLAVPAIGAPGDAPRAKAKIPTAPRAIGAFTPAAADPRLAAALAKAGIGSGNFRFTPTDARREGNRAITVAVRSTGIETGRTGMASAAPAAVSMAPIAYNLGAAVGWKRFALSGDLTRVDLGAQPGSRESVDLGLAYVDKRAVARVKATADRPLAGGPRLVEEPKSYSVDVNGTYSLTRNIDLTAGLRYKTDRDRLERFRDDRRDSQAVYVGTAFKF